MTEVASFPKTNVGECGCGCGKFGTYRKRPWSSGVLCVRTCTACKSCTGRHTKLGGQKEQGGFQKAAGIRKSRHKSRNTHEEAWEDPFRWEVKSGAQVRPVVTAYLKTRAQSEATRAIGDHRPFAMGASYEKTRVVVVDAEVWRTYIVPLLEESA